MTAALSRYDPIKGCFVLKDLKLNDLFQLDLLRSPTTFIKFQYSIYFSETEEKTGFDPDWTSDLENQPIDIPLNSSADPDPSRNNLEILIYSKNYFSKDTLIGTVKIHINPHHATYIDKQPFTISFSDARVVKNAKLKAESESRSLPSLTLSINSKDSK